MIGKVTGMVFENHLNRGPYCLVFLPPFEYQTNFSGIAMFEYLTLICPIFNRIQMSDIQIRGGDKQGYKGG